MALFFRGKARKFFLILLGAAPSEKNHAGFDRKLREFSRGAAGGVWMRVGPGEAVASNTRGYAGSEPQRAVVGARGPRGKGSRGEAGGVLTHRTHSVRIGRGGGMSTIPRCARSGRARSPVDCTAFRVVASVGGCPHIDHRSAVERWRHSPSTFTASRVDVGGRYPHRRTPVRPLRRSLSPVASTDLRVDSAARYPHGCPPVRRSWAAARSSRQGRRAFGGRGPGASLGADWRPQREHWRGFGAHRYASWRCRTTCGNACGYRRRHTLKRL